MRDTNDSEMQLSFCINENIIKEFRKTNNNNNNKSTT